MKILRYTGKCSTFGGPDDMGVAADEGLSLIQTPDLDNWYIGRLFLPQQPHGTSGLARRLNPLALYLAMRWDFNETPKQVLKMSLCLIEANGKHVWAQPADWGPNIRTNRIVDLSPGAARAIGVKTDDEVSVSLILV